MTLLRLCSHLYGLSSKIVKHFLMKTALQILLQGYLKLVPDTLPLSSYAKIYTLIGIMHYQSKLNPHDPFNWIGRTVFLWEKI